MNKSLWYLYEGSVAAGCVAAASPAKSNLYAYLFPEFIHILRIIEILIICKKKVHTNVDKLKPDLN